VSCCCAQNSGTAGRQWRVVRLRSWVCLLAGVGWMFAAAVYAAAALVDEPAPPFEARDLQGQWRRLSDYRGRIVVLEWSTPECLYSRRYMDNGTLAALVEYAAREGIVWINIVPRLETMSREAAVRQLQSKEKTVILDHSLAISTAYGVRATPQILIVDRQGRLVYSGAIDSSAMLKKTRRPPVPYVREALDDLLAGRAVRRKITRAFGCYVRHQDELQSGQPRIIERDSP